MRIYHFRGGGEISPPLRPWCKEKTSDSEGLKEYIIDSKKRINLIYHIWCLDRKLPKNWTFTFGFPPFCRFSTKTVLDLRGFRSTRHLHSP